MFKKGVAEEVDLESLLSILKKMWGETAFSSEEALKHLERAGFKETKRALSNLFSLASRVSGDGILKLLKSVLGSPEPDRALNGIEQVIGAVSVQQLVASKEAIEYLFGDDLLLSYLAIIAAASPYLTGILIKNPDFFSPLFLQDGIKNSKDLSSFLKELKEWTAGINGFDDMARALRLYKQRESLRIGARDLCGLAGFEEISGELSDLASASLEVGLRFCKEELKKKYGTPIELLPDGTKKEAEFTIIGMGKFGGRELNFSSDIDILYLYSSDKGETTGVEGQGGSRGKIDLHTFYVKLSERLTRLIGQPTGDGVVFRVDLDLRPEGKNGDLANSLRSMEIYYESWGQTWERSALIKARPVAGSMELGEEFLKMIEPFVYRRYLDFTAIDEIKGMKEKIDLNMVKKRETIDVKLSRGGIREIEFFIQALQLINGGKNRRIRERNTLEAIKRLKEEGYIKGEEEEELREAYIFLRTVEHRIQLLYGRQSHSLSGEERELLCLSKQLNLYPSTDVINYLTVKMEKIHSIYERLFYKPSKSLKEDVSQDLMAVLEEVFSKEEALKVLQSYGFKNPEKVLSDLKLLKEGPPFAHYSMKARQYLKKLAPFLLTKAAAMPDPDMALSNTERFLSRLGARTTLLSLLVENKVVTELLVGLFGTSAFLSRFLIEHPELLDSFITEDIRREVKTKGEMKGELGFLLERELGYEDVLNAIRRYRNIEIFRIGINNINGRLSLEDVSSQITALADVSLQKAFEIAWKDLSLRYGEPIYHKGGEEEKARFCILGLGKLGGEELLYGSDLDIIFIYSHSGETDGARIITNHEFFTKLAQRIISILSMVTSEGFVFKVDTRLRPSGSSGPIVTSLSAFDRYHRERAAIWEKQALLKARFSAGDPEFGEEVISLVQQLIYETPLTRADKEEISRLRFRMERELGRETEERVDVKFGMGGLVDIEFIVELLQLRYGRDKKGIRKTNTLKALDAIERENLLPLEDSHFLKSTYSFYRCIENRLRIVEDRAGSKLLLTDPQLENLCRGLGYSDLKGFIEDYRERRERVRSIYNKIQN